METKEEVFFCSVRDGRERATAAMEREREKKKLTKACENHLLLTLF